MYQILDIKSIFGDIWIFHSHVSWSIERINNFMLTGLFLLLKTGSVTRLQRNSSTPTNPFWEVSLRSETFSHSSTSSLLYFNHLVPELAVKSGRGSTWMCSFLPVAAAALILNWCRLLA